MRVARLHDRFPVFTGNINNEEGEGGNNVTGCYLRSTAQIVPFKSRHFVKYKALFCCFDTFRIDFWGKIAKKLVKLTHLTKN